MTNESDAHKATLDAKLNAACAHVMAALAPLCGEPTVLTADEKIGNAGDNVFTAKQPTTTLVELAKRLASSKLHVKWTEGTWKTHKPSEDASFYANTGPAFTSGGGKYQIGISIHGKKDQPVKVVVGIIQLE